jgi:hypothetical protein
MGNGWPVASVLFETDGMEEIPVCFSFGESPLVSDCIVDIRFVCGASNRLFVPV